MTFGFDGSRASVDQWPIWAHELAIFGFSSRRSPVLRLLISVFQSARLNASFSVNPDRCAIDPRCPALSHRTHPQTFTVSAR